VDVLDIKNICLLSKWLVKLLNEYGACRRCVSLLSKLYLENKDTTED
jgi:hypothetical protein